VIPSGNWNCAFCVNHVQASETSLYESCSSILTSICTCCSLSTGPGVLCVFLIDSSVCEIKIRQTYCTISSGNPRNIFFPVNRCQRRCTAVPTCYSYSISSTETIRSLSACQKGIACSDTVLCICRISISLGLGFIPRPAVCLTLAVR
jgi:hypothetical protein